MTKAAWRVVFVVVLLFGGAVVGLAQQVDDLRITILYDNVPYDERLSAEWGFSALIEIGEHVVLFDTGGLGETLMGNIAAFDVDVGAIDVIVLSHEHGDHVGGLERLLDSGIAPTVYAPASFPGWLKNDIRGRTELIEVTDAVEIFPGVISTGEMGAHPIEQSLILETASGTVVITGCAHPGIVGIAERAVSLVPDEVLLVIGGLHLLNHTRAEVRGIAGELQDLGVRHVCPTHCTGDDAIRVFEEEYGTGFVPGGVGRVLTLGDLAETD